MKGVLNMNEHSFILSEVRHDCKDFLSSCGNSGNEGPLYGPSFPELRESRPGGRLSGPCGGGAWHTLGKGALLRPACGGGATCNIVGISNPPIGATLRADNVAGGSSREECTERQAHSNAGKPFTVRADRTCRL